MEIYKYKIWTGNIPGSETESCEDKKLIQPTRNVPTTSLDCTPCEALGDPMIIMNACLDCHNGLINPCCPSANESCCGITEDPCVKLYEMSPEKQIEYCNNCINNQESISEKSRGNTYVFGDRFKNKFSDPQHLCHCCNRTGRKNTASQLTIFLEQDINDIGHYTMWDGTMDQQDTFSNFVVTGDLLNPMTVSVLNTTDFKFYKFLENIQYTIDWGEPLSAPQTITAPLDTTFNTYTTPGTYTINIQMSAPWGVNSVSHTITVPYQTGANIWAAVTNTGQTYTFTPPGFSTPVSMDYETSDWGPLDSGLDINGYVTSYYTTTPYPIQGYTDSMLSSLQSYNPAFTPGLPPGYVVGQTVNVAGQSQLPDGSFVDNMQGWVDSFTSNYTAYTITNGTLTFTMFDYINGETIFETQGYGMNPEDYLLRECGYAIQGACDICNVVQVYNSSGTWVTQDVFNDRGVWDINETYEPTDFVFHDGCCYFAISSVITIEPDPLDLTSSFWRLCYGSCPLSTQLPDKYDCIGGTCVLISPTSTYYPTAPYSGPTTADALAACIASPCVPNTADPIHYNCDDGVCTPVSPSDVANYGSADYTGINALANCQADVVAGICVSPTTRYNCVPDGMGGAQCQQTPVGIYPDLTSCQASCTVNVTVYDWYCTNVAITASNPTGQACQAVLQGDPPPGNAVTPIQGPYVDKPTCESAGCGITTYQYYCRCTIGAEQTIVDLGGGQYGGTACVAIANGPAGGYASIGDCEDNCLSWECDGNGNCDGPNSVTSGNLGSYCSDTTLTSGGLKYWTDGTYMDIPGCNDECLEPDTWICMGGNCTQVFQSNTTCINPSHVNNGTAFNGSCIDWNFANNMPEGGCQNQSEAGCNANLGSFCEGGCGPCQSLTNEGFTEWPFKKYNSSDSYNAFDVVIAFNYTDSQNNSQYKYWYKPYPICDPTMGTIIDNGVSYDCSDPSVIAVCESSAYGSGVYHPCTDLSAPACDTPPIINMPPPTTAGQSRFLQTPKSCWEPCDG